jgi:hypothetical protein
MLQNAIFARARLLESEGPTLGRPYADQLAGSDYANMKELRVATKDGVWRVAFAFDPARQAVLLVAGNKVGVKQQRFYRSLIRRDDTRFRRYLDELDDKQ